MRPYHLLVPSENIALSDKNTKLTYNEFIKEIHKINAWYKEQGYHDGHRISVVGINSVHTYLYLFAAALDMCATTLPWGEDLKQAYKNGEEGDWKFRLDANKSNAIVYVNLDGTVDLEHLHYEKSTVLDKEIMLYYSSGTSHPYGWTKSYPVPYELDENNYGTSQDVTHYYRERGNKWYRSPETNRTINSMGPYIGWGQEVTFTTIAKGGHCHLIYEQEEYAEAAKWVKPTWLAGFPLAWQKVIDKGDNGGHSIEVFEYSGAALIDGQKEEFEKFFGHSNWICGYGDAATGMTLVNYSNNFDTIGKPIECLVNSGAEYRLSKENSTIEFRGPMTPDGDWWDTGDIAEINEEGNWILKGRANELIIVRGGGKVYPFEVEHIISQHPGVKEVYVYPQPDENLHFVPACIYNGDVSPQELQEWCKGKMQPFKQPVKYTSLVSTVAILRQATCIPKVSRVNIHNTLIDNPDWIKNNE